MVSIVLGMLVCVGLAVGVVLLVAVPARREGRDLLTPRGEEVVGSLRDVTARRIGRGDATSGQDDLTPGQPDVAESREDAPTR